jgi:hypothetical protein
MPHHECSGSVGAVRERVDVDTDRERPGIDASEDDGTNAWIILYLLKSCLQSIQYGVVDGVQLLRSIELDDGNAIA